MEEEVDAPSSQQTNSYHNHWKDYIDLNYWTVEYTKIRKDNEICRCVHKVQKRRRFFAVPLQEPQFEKASGVSQQGLQEEQLLTLPSIGTVFVELEKDEKETRWMVVKSFPATMKVRARNDFNIVKTFKWPQDNLKVISFGQGTVTAVSDSKVGKG